MPFVAPNETAFTEFTEMTQGSFKSVRIVMNCGSPLLGIDPVTPDMPGPSAVATTITTECTSVEEKPTALDLSQYPTVVCMLYVHA